VAFSPAADARYSPLLCTNTYTSLIRAAYKYRYSAAFHEKFRQQFVATDRTCIKLRACIEDWLVAHCTTTSCSNSATTSTTAAASGVDTSACGGSNTQQQQQLSTAAANNTANTATSVTVKRKRILWDEFMQHNTDSTDTANSSCMTTTVDHTTAVTTIADATTATAAAAAAAATGGSSNSEHAATAAHADYSAQSNWPHTQQRLHSSNLNSSSNLTAAGLRCDFCTQGECRLYPLLPTVGEVIGAARKCALQALHSNNITNSSSNSRAVQQLQHDSVHIVRTSLCEVS
jgi:hypothetical protein